MVLFSLVEEIPTLAISIPLKLTQRKFGKSHALIHQGLSNPERRASAPSKHLLRYVGLSLPVVWTRTHQLLIGRALQHMYQLSFYYHSSLGNGLSPFTQLHKAP